MATAKRSLTFSSLLHWESDKPWIIATFLVAAFAGWPIWYYSTAVHRFQLPFDAIQQWDVKQLDVQLPYAWTVHHGKHLAISLASDSFDPPASLPVKRIRLELQVAYEQITASQLKQIEALENIDQIIAAVDATVHKANIQNGNDGSYHAYVLERPALKTWSVVIGHQRSLLLLIPPGMAKISSVLQAVMSAIRAHELQCLLNGLSTSKDQTLRAVKYSSGYQLSFSLFNGDSDNSVYSWDIQEALSAYMELFFSYMSEVSTLHVSSQAQEYAALHVVPTFNKEMSRYELDTSVAPYVISADWNSASSVADHELNFILYAPNRDVTPLVILDETKRTVNGILVPQWGAFTVLQPTNGTQHLTKTALKPYMAIFLSQMRELLGLQSVWPENETGQYVEKTFSIKVQSTANPAGVTTWEMDKLLRYRITENIIATAETLSSLARLVKKMPNMPVGQQIADKVTRSLYHLQMAYAFVNVTDIRSLGNPMQAFKHSRRAVEYAETAFFDPTMISMLYFPDEHLLAVYAPLLLPVAVPVFLSIVRVLKRRKQLSPS